MAINCLLLFLAQQTKSPMLSIYPTALYFMSQEETTDKFTRI